MNGTTGSFFLHSGQSLPRPPGRRSREVSCPRPQWSMPGPLPAEERALRVPSAPPGPCDTISCDHRAGVTAATRGCNLSGGQIRAGQPAPRDGSTLLGSCSPATARGCPRARSWPGHSRPSPRDIAWSPPDPEGPLGRSSLLGSSLECRGRAGPGTCTGSKSCKQHRRRSATRSRQVPCRSRDGRPGVFSVTLKGHA